MQPGCEDAPALAAGGFVTCRSVPSKPTPSTAHSRFVACSALGAAGRLAASRKGKRVGRGSRKRHRGLHRPGACSGGGAAGSQPRQRDHTHPDELADMPVRKLATGYCSITQGCKVSTLLSTHQGANSLHTVPGAHAIS